MPSKKRKASSTKGKLKRGRSDRDSSPTSSAPNLTKQISHYNGKLQFDEDDIKKLQEPLIGTWMHLKMYAVTFAGDKILNLDDAFPLKVSLTCDSGGTEVTETHQSESGLPALEVKGNYMSKSGTATIQLKINTLSRYFESSRFSLRVQPADDANVSGLKEVKTPTFNVVSQRLKVTDLGGEEDGLIGKFYKDEGGKEKFLEYSVELKDARGICADREVPLKVTLHYDTENRPEANEMTNNGKQTLMSFDETNELIVKNGKGIVKIRINDVSKNHYSNGFLIRVGPKLEGDGGVPENSDISAGWSGTTIVKSKRAKNIPVAVRKKQAAALAAKQAMGLGSVIGSVRKGSKSGRGGGRGVADTAGNATGSGRKPRSKKNKKNRSQAMPVLPQSLKNDLKRNISVPPSVAINTLSEWGQTLTNSLLQMQQCLVPFISFSDDVALPLLQQVSIYNYTLHYKH